MSERRSSADLGPSVEAALGNFPFPERDWEEDALAVEARLPHAGATDAALLAAPLPSEPGEPHAPPSATSTPLTHSGVRPQSLAEIARRSVEKKHAAEREMARESLALAAKRPSAVEVQALREAMNKQLAAASANAGVASGASGSAPRASGVVSAQGPAALPPPRAKAGATSWPRLGLIAAGIAMAAGFVFWLRLPGAAAPTGALRAATTAAQKTVAATGNANANANAAGPNATQPSTAPEAAPTAVNPDTLPQSEPMPAGPAHDKAAATHAPAPSARANGGKAEKIELEDEPEQPMARAAPAPEPSVAKALPADPALRPADSTGGAIPAKPSSGAVQAALGAVMSGARRCVVGEDTPSSALVVFGSDGRVQSVSVSGPAAGRPSGGCIQAQLGRARVQPFAASSFSVSATVRPD